MPSWSSSGRTTKRTRRGEVPPTRGAEGLRSGSTSTYSSSTWWVGGRDQADQGEGDPGNPFPKWEREEGYGSRYQEVPVNLSRNSTFDPLTHSLQRPCIQSSWQGALLQVDPVHADHHTGRHSCVDPVRDACHGRAGGLGRRRSGPLSGRPQVRG